MKPNGWKLREQLDQQTAAEMVACGYGKKDLEAIRFLSNNKLDEFERAGLVTRAESNKLSQAVTIRNVKALMFLMMKRAYKADEYLNSEFLEWPTARVVGFPYIEVIDDSHCTYHGKTYAAKENLRYKPTNVRLVDIGGAR